MSELESLVQELRYQNRNLHNRLSDANTKIRELECNLDDAESSNKSLAGEVKSFTDSRDNAAINDGLYSPSCSYCDERLGDCDTAWTCCNCHDEDGNALAERKEGGDDE